ncbi:ABC transporter substrate-binding protein [Vibrio sp. HN007]|uniref:ABC transporter substrate-binding protein n=1 Tax=Vibrio iocasae TaxID=3098914 RepID=UPI0035D45D96
MTRNWGVLCILLTSFSISFFVRSESILVVESYHSEHPWDQSYKQGLQEVLGEHFVLSYYEMDTKRIPREQYQERADAAWKLYQEYSPVLVVIADDNALEALAPRFLKTNTPVVYLGINANPRKYGVANAPNFSGVIERPLLKRSVLMLNKFMSVKKVLVLFDESETSNVILEDIFYGKKQAQMEGMVLDIKLIQNTTEWKKQVLTAKEHGYDALVVGLYHTLTDEQGDHINSEDVIRWTSLNTKVPSFGFWDFSVGKDKNVGGYVVSGYEEGKLAGQIALGMLQGKRVRVRPQSGGQGAFLFSQYQLSKWNITLPPEIFNQSQILE